MAFLDEHTKGIEAHQSHDKNQDSEFPCDHHHNETCSHFPQNINIPSLQTSWIPFIWKYKYFLIPLNVHFNNELQFRIWQPPRKSYHSLLPS